MANENLDRPLSLLNSINRITEKIVNDGAGYDTLINILALFCLVSILQRNTQPVAQSSPVSSGGLQKLLGDLTKGDGGPSPDALMSLLPLLNSPQMKSKLNPTTIATVLGLLNSMGGDKSDSQKQEKDKSENKTEQKAETHHPQVSQASPETETPPAATGKVTPLEPSAEKKTASRYLNWKTSF